MWGSSAGHGDVQSNPNSQVMETEARLWIDSDGDRPGDPLSTGGCLDLALRRLNKQSVMQQPLAKTSEVCVDVSRRVRFSAELNNTFSGFPLQPTNLPDGRMSVVYLSRLYELNARFRLSDTNHIVNPSKTELEQIWDSPLLQPSDED